MAWIAFFSILFITGAVLNIFPWFNISVETIKASTGIISMSLTALAGVVGAYMGFASYENVKKKEK